MMDEREYERMAAVEGAMWWYAGMREITAALLERFFVGAASLNSSLSGGGFEILDAGCGTGANFDFLKRYGRVTGFDFAARALHFCTGRNVSRASIIHIPFADERFDLTTSFDVIFMMSLAQGVAALRELARVTRAGGYVLLRVAAYDWLRGRHDAAWATQHRYTLRELVARVCAAGLQPVFTSYANMLLFPFALLKRGFDSVIKIGGDSDTVLPSPIINRLLINVLRCEARFMRRARLPFGLSAMVLARKPNSGYKKSLTSA